MSNMEPEAKKVRVVIPKDQHKELKIVAIEMDTTLENALSESIKLGIKVLKEKRNIS